MKALSIALNAFFYIVIIVLLVFSIANIQVKKQSDIPHILGRGFLAVRSDSMEGEREDSFNKGDLVFVDMLSEDEQQELSEGDIVTYFDMGIRALNTHRIVDTFDLDGERFIITRGDNTPGDDDPIRASDAIAIYRSKWEGAGDTIAYLQSPVGFALFIILPVALILIYQGIVLTRNIVALNRTKLEEKYESDQQRIQQDLERERQKMREQLLEELKKEENKQDKK
ncbi:MAG: signal peptidase I [Acholeplasmataceae bacterium]